MTVHAKLAGFALSLIVVFGAGYGIGAATETPAKPARSHQGHGA